jgi:hypothetical protein
MTPGTTVRIILISTGSSSIAKHGTVVLDRVLDELNGSDNAEVLATKHIMGLSEIYSALASSASREKINIDANILDWSYVSQPYRAYFGIVDGLQLKEWWTKHDRRIVAKNIRHSLGSTEVNEQIRGTAINTPDIFGISTTALPLLLMRLSKHLLRLHPVHLGYSSSREPQ